METLWKVVGFILGLLTVELCNGLPINLEISGPDPHTQYLTGLIAVLLAICSVVLLAGCVCCRRNKNGFTEFRDSPVVAASVASNLDHGHVNPIANSEFTIFTPISPTHHNNNVFLANQRIVNRTQEDYKYEDIDVSSWFDGSEKDFPRTRLKYIRELGKGWFGRVVEGTAQGISNDPGEPDWTPVVVRILEPTASSKERVLFLHDADIYRCGYHPNMLALLGRCLDTTPLLLLQEYCTEGDLKRYLIAAQPTKSKFLTTDLPLLWCYQLTQALKFLHEQKVAHPDLAARNCQLTKDLTLKLGDYGLNASFYPEDYYQGSPAIPLRWCPPEVISYTNTTIQCKKVTLDSNIWSLGVTMWEIFECGSQPYSNLSDDEVISQVLGSANVRLPRPTCNVIYTDYMYKLMQSCWSTSESRPPVTQIDLMVTDLMRVAEHTKITTDIDPPSIQDFDRRWETLKPNTLQVTDETPLITKSGNDATGKSPSLTNLHGSLDNLLDSSLDIEINRSRDSSEKGSPKALHFQLGPKAVTTSESETEDENWKKKIERGAYTEKVRQKSRSVADLMVLTHVDYSESDSETLPSLTEQNRGAKPKFFKNMENPALKFGSEGNLLSVQDTFQDELKKLQEERRDSLLFVPDKFSQSNFSENNALEHSPVKKLMEELNSPSEMIPPHQVYNVFNVSVKHLNAIDNKEEIAGVFSCDSPVESKLISESDDAPQSTHIKDLREADAIVVSDACDKRLCQSDEDLFSTYQDSQPSKPEHLPTTKREESPTNFPVPLEVKIEVLSDQSSPIDEELEDLDLTRPGSSDDYMIRESKNVKLRVPKLSDSKKEDLSEVIDKDSGLNTPENSASLEKLNDDMEEILDEAPVLKKCPNCATSLEENEVYTGSFDSDKSDLNKVECASKDLHLMRSETKICSSDGSGCEEDSGTGVSSKETQSIDDNLSAKSLEDALDNLNTDYCLRRSKLLCESFLANEKSNYSPTEEFKEICFANSKQTVFGLSEQSSFENLLDLDDKPKVVVPNIEVRHVEIVSNVMPDLLNELPPLSKESLDNEEYLNTLKTTEDYIEPTAKHLIENSLILESNDLSKDDLNKADLKTVEPVLEEGSSEQRNIENLVKDSTSPLRDKSENKSIEENIEKDLPELTLEEDTKEVKVEASNQENDSTSLLLEDLPELKLEEDAKDVKEDVTEQKNIENLIENSASLLEDLPELKNSASLLEDLPELKNNASLLEDLPELKNSASLLNDLPELKLEDEMVTEAKKSLVEAVNTSLLANPPQTLQMEDQEDHLPELKLEEDGLKISNKVANTTLSDELPELKLENNTSNEEINITTETNITTTLDLLELKLDDTPEQNIMQAVNTSLLAQLPELKLEEELPNFSFKILEETENLDSGTLNKSVSSSVESVISDKSRSGLEYLSPEDGSQASDFKTVSECSKTLNYDAQATDNSVPNTMLDISSDDMKTLEDTDSSRTIGGDSDCDLNNFDDDIRFNDDSGSRTEEDGRNSVRNDSKVQISEGLEECNGNAEQEDLLRRTQEFLKRELLIYEKCFGDVGLNVENFNATQVILPKELEGSISLPDNCNATQVIHPKEMEENISLPELEENISRQLEENCNVTPPNPLKESMSLPEESEEDICSTTIEENCNSTHVIPLKESEELIKTQLVEPTSDPFNTTIILNKTKDFLNNEVESYAVTSLAKPQVQFDLSDSQEEISPSSLTHFQAFTSTPFTKKTRNLESTVILGASDDYSIDYYSGLKTAVDPVESEYSPNFLKDPASDRNDLYSLETWDNFLGKSFDEQESDRDYFNEEPHSLLFLENTTLGQTKVVDAPNLTHNLAVSATVNETYVPEQVRNDGTFCKKDLDGTFDVNDKEGNGTFTKAGDGTFVKAGDGTFVKDGDGTFVKAGDGTFVKDGDGTFVKDGDGTFVKDADAEDAAKPGTSSGWESGGGWFLHPQSTSEDLSGQIAVQQESKDSYVGFSMDDDVMTAIRNELMSKLPHAQRAASEQVEQEELEPAEKNEVYIRYNVYNTPLSPIPEESYVDSEDDYIAISPTRLNDDSDDDSSDWSIQDNVSSYVYTETPKNAQSPSKKTSKQEPSCSSYIAEESKATNHGDEENFTSKPEDRKEIEIPKINIHSYITDFLNNERYNQLNSSIELGDLKSEPEEVSSTSDIYLTVSDNTFNFGQNVAPLNSPEDRQWKDLQASFRDCESEEKPQDNTYLTRLEDTFEEDRVGRNFELVTDLDDPEFDNLEEKISDEDIDKILQEDLEGESSDTVEENKPTIKQEEGPKLDERPKLEEILTPEETPKVEDISKLEETPKLEDTPKLKETLKLEDIPKLEDVPKSEDAPKLENASKLEETLKSEVNQNPADGFRNSDIEAEYVEIPKHDSSDYENAWIADTIYANMPADRAKEIDYVNAEELQSKTTENIDDLYGPLADIRFSGPGLQMMSTSFSESNEIGDEQDWDSGSDTRSSSSGEFIWREGEHEASVKALDAAPQAEQPDELVPMEDIPEENESSSGSDCDDECPEFVPSAWDKYAVPSKSAMRSPEKTLQRKDKDKKEDRKSRGVSFKKQKYHCIYEYPREPDSPILQSYEHWKPTPDFATLADWELGPDMYLPTPLDNPLTSVAPGPPKNLYQLTAFGKDPDNDFYISGSSRPFDMLGSLATSQFFPGKQFSDHWIDNATPDSGVEDVPTPETGFPTLKQLASHAANKNQNRELGGLRHTRSKLKLDLPPSPSAFSGNTTFTVEPAEEIVPRQVPTFSTFGKSRFLVQHVDTPPDDKLLNKNVSFEALPYKPAPQIMKNDENKERHRVEIVRGEASLLDSADEDSGIESCTLERQKNVNL